MEPHPIPQNVTAFQFHLVGDMTLKQFLYLSGGCGFAYLLFVTIAVKYPYIAWPLIAISTLLGIAFAFMPIGSRPLDHWLGAFLKAIYSPTKRVWNKNGQIYNQTPLFNSRLMMYLSAQQAQMPNPPASQPAIPSQPQMKQPAPVINQQPKPVQPQVQTPLLTPDQPPSLPTTDELAQTVDLARQAQNLQIRILQTERALNQIKAEAQQPATIPVDYTDQVNKIMADLKNLVSQASQTHTKLDQLTKPEQQQTQEVKPKEKIKVVVSAKEKLAQLALTTFPNVINGIVKDKNGDYLEGTVAVIHDKEGLPVRALKTNKLGQFTGSTPLPNGIYTLELEKDNYIFDVLQIELSGQVLPPLLITAKS